MGPKAKNKGKEAKLNGTQPKPKEYRLITLSELRLREAKHFQRLSDLKTVLNFLDDAFVQVEKYENKRRIREKWEKFVRCDGLPKPYSPPEVRLFFVQLRHFENKNVTKTIDWLLSVDERSILSQDIFRKDRTKRTLINQIRPNIGLEYDQNIELGLKVLKDIEYLLDDTNLIELIPDRILDDIIEQKTAVHQEIQQFFDRFAYRVLCSEDAYMDQIDAISTEYRYQAKNFEIHIWTLKKVPILFDSVETPSLMANLSNIKIELQIPFSLLQENLTIRGVHMNFDHYSEHAKSFEQKIDAPVDQLNAGITDLYESLTVEWAMQMAIMQEVRNGMIKTRQEYEDHLKLLEEENAKKEKEKRGAAGGKKKKGPAKKAKSEPPLLTDDIFPDVWEAFLERDSKQNEDFLNAVFHPNVLKLTDQEINLKKYMMLGGIYQLYVVTKPNHTRFNSFNMTWHANDGQLNVDKDIIANLSTRRKDASKSRLTITQRKSRRKTEIIESKSKILTKNDIIEKISRLAMPSNRSLLPEKRSRFKSRSDTKMAGEADDFTRDPELSPFFIITFELPSYLCLWSEPIPCHFEADILGLVEIVEMRLPSFLLPETTMSVRSEVGETSEVSSAIAQSSALATSSGGNISLSRAPSRDGSSTRHSSTINIYKTLSTFNVRKILAQTVRELPQIENFNINLPMTKQQIRKLQRHCVPRIISSYKFPVEVAEEETEEAKFKPKGEAGTLVRKRLSGSDDQLNKNMDSIFAFKNQTNPERIFPIYSKKESLFTPEKADEATILSNPPETFFELVQSLDYVKKRYKTLYRGITDIPQVVQRRDLIHRKFGSTSSARFRRITGQTAMRRSLTLLGSKHNVSERIDEKDISPDENEKLRKSQPKLRQSSPKERFSSPKAARSSGLPRTRKSSSLARKSKKTKEKLKKLKSSESPEEKPPETRLEKYSHWTRAHIYHQIYDKEACKITIWTDRLGTIGFAYKRYEHFPFRSWSVQPSEENPEKEIIVTIDTQHARCIIYVTPEGYRGVATEKTLKYKKNIETYLEIKEPIKDLKELKKRFRERNVNIFSEHDARFYIEKGYFSEKHLATELHSYACMAIHGSFIKFVSSSWNRLATRREIVLRFGHYKELEEQLALTRVTPEGATFVEIKELCSDDLNVFKLEYTLTWRNIDFYADLHHCVMSMYPSATDSRVKNANLITGLKNLLFEIRPISYS